MYTVTKPDQTMTICFEGEEWDTVTNYAKWQGVTPNFFIACALQTTIRSVCKLFPRQLMMPGALDREMAKNG